jgi:hypothetical protein
MTAPAARERPNKKQAALALVKKGLYIGPLCWPDDQGRCACPKHHTGHAVGKAPFSKGA